jgi:hypothetical protein
MSAEVKKEIQLEIAHVLFMDIVGYSKRLINEQRANGRRSIRLSGIQSSSETRMQVAP